MTVEILNIHIPMRSNNNNLHSMNGHLEPDHSVIYDCESSSKDLDQITEPEPKIYTPDTVSRYTRYRTKTEIHK